MMFDNDFENFEVFLVENLSKKKRYCFLKKNLNVCNILYFLRNYLIFSNKFWLFNKERFFSFFCLQNYFGILGFFFIFFFPNLVNNLNFLKILLKEFNGNIVFLRSENFFKGSSNFFGINNVIFNFLNFKNFFGFFFALVKNQKNIFFDLSFIFVNSANNSLFLTFNDFLSIFIFILKYLKKFKFILFFFFF